jgi:hypothetical protein
MISENVSSRDSKRLQPHVFSYNLSSKKSNKYDCFQAQKIQENFVIVNSKKVDEETEPFN